jgi:curved DNA-binding protein CbpA
MSDLIDEARRKLASLELPADASWEQIKDRYRFLAKVWHPDRFGADPRARSRAESQFKSINETYQWLMKHKAVVDSIPGRDRTAGHNAESNDDARVAEQPEPAPEPQHSARPQHRPAGARQTGASAIEKFLWGVVAAFSCIGLLIFIASSLPDWLDREDSGSGIGDSALAVLSPSSSTPGAGGQIRGARDAESRAGSVTPGGRGAGRASANPGADTSFSSFAARKSASSGQGAPTSSNVEAAGDESSGDLELIRGAWKPKYADPTSRRRETAASSDPGPDLEHWSGAVEGVLPTDLPRVTIRLYEDVEVGKPIGAAVYWHEAGTCTYTLELREQVESGMRADQISQSSECAPQGEIWFVTGEDDMTVVWHRADGSRWFSSRLRID